VNAEDPERDFLPVAGEVEFFLPPGGPGVRIDSHIYAGYTLPTSYDSLLAKIVTWADTRDEALNRMRRALNECVITGIPTTIPFHLALLDDPVFRGGNISTSYVSDVLQRWKGQ
jgi:acetyl-CoA carboxylase biotin carboxylase subunit